MISYYLLTLLPTLGLCGFRQPYKNSGNQGWKILIPEKQKHWYLVVNLHKTNKYPHQGPSD